MPKIWKCMRSLMTSEQVSASANVATAIAAIVGFGLTVWSINSATRQLQANNEYEIRRDLRDIAIELEEVINLSCIRGENDCDQAARLKTSQGYAVLMNFFFAIYYQASSDAVSANFETEMARDFCFWVESDFGQRFWRDKARNQDYSQSRFDIKEEWCS